MICPKCGHDGTDPVECPRCGVIFAKVKIPEPRALPGEPVVSEVVLPADDRQRFAYGGFGLYVGILPAAILVDLLLVLLILPRYLLDWVSVLFHELGHALFHWLSSRAALPLALGPGAGWTTGNVSQSVFVGVCVVFLISVMGYHGIRHRTWGLVSMAGALLVAWVAFTFLVPDRTWLIIMILAGLGAEPVLGTLCIIAFYYRLPDRIRWDFFRFPTVVLGTYVTFRSAWLWLKISAGNARLPYGTGLFGSSDAQGDLDRLRWEHGFSESGLIGIYLALNIVCGLVILAHYVGFAYREWLRRKRPPEHL